MLDTSSIHETTTAPRPDTAPEEARQALHIGLPRSLEEEDLATFRGKSLEVGTLRLSAEIRRGLMGELCITAFDRNGYRCDVVIPPHRARIFSAGLGRHLENEMRDLKARGETCAPRDILVEVGLTAVRAQRRWRDNHGKWRVVPRLIAAQWSYELVEAGFERQVEEGQLPRR